MCFACGKLIYLRCAICDTSLYFLSQKGSNNKKRCFFDYINDSYFGLCKDNRVLIKRDLENGNYLLPPK